jgi:hypothetical protein
MNRQINWTRGLTRIYLLLVLAWALYWIVWIPLEQVRNWQTLAINVYDESQRTTYLSQANLLAQWKELGKEFARSPMASVALLVLPPLLVYGLLRLTLFTANWVFSGFQHDNDRK